MKKDRYYLNKATALILAVSIIASGFTFSIPTAYASDEAEDKYISAGFEYNGYPVIRGYTTQYTEILDSVVDTDEEEKEDKAEEDTKEEEDKKDTVKKQLYRLSFCYSDGYFLDSTTANNVHLATTSSMMAEYMDSGDARLKDIFQNLGFVKRKYKDWNLATSEDTIGVSTAYKVLYEGTEKECVLVPVVVRGGGYGCEWGSNFHLGLTGNAAGMSGAADKAYAWIEKYIKEKNLDEKNIKLWVMGYSRAGAVSNMLSKQLTDKYGKKNVYGFTFEAPKAVNATRGEIAKYRNIKNYRNNNDFVPALYPASLGMSLYGEVITFADISDADFAEQEARMLQQEKLIENKSFKYASPTSVKSAKLQVNSNTLMTLLRSGSVYEVGGNIDPSDFNAALEKLLKKTVMSSREKYVNEIPSDVLPAASALGVEAVSYETAMRYFGSTIYAESGDFVKNLKKLLTDPVVLIQVVPKLRSFINYATTRNADYLPATVTDLWDALSVSRGSYKGFNELLDEEQCQKLKQAFPTLIYAVCWLADVDKQSAGINVVGTYLYNIDFFRGCHVPALNYCWLRSFDSFYDEAKLNAVNEYEIVETRLWGDSADDFNGTSIKVYDADQTEVAIIENGELKYAKDRALNVISSRNKLKQNTEFALHTPLEQYKITITSTADTSKSLHVGRNNIASFSETKSMYVLDSKGNKHNEMNVALAPGQTVEIVVGPGTTKLNCEDALAVEDTNPDYTVSYKSQFVYTGKKIAIPKITISGPNKNEYRIVKAKASKTIGMHKIATIKFKGDRYSGSKVLYYTIVPSGTKLSKLSSTTNTVSASWKKNLQSTSGYQLEYSDNKSFDNSKIKTVGGNTKSGITVRELKRNKTYYFRVRTYKKVSGERICSKWSATKKINTKSLVNSKKKSAKLPAKYQAVEYLHSDGVQYIDTGIIPDENTGIDIAYKLDSTSATTRIFGASAIDTQNRLTSIFDSYASKAGNNYLRYGAVSLGIKSSTDKLRIVIDELKYSFAKESETVKSGTFQKTDFHTDTSIALFASNSAGGLYRGSGLSIYDCKLTDKGSVVADFVPCYRKSDGKTGMYDLYRDKFYASEAGGEFQLGPEVDNSSVTRTYTPAEKKAEETITVSPDVFSLKLNADGSAYDGVSGEALEKLGNAKVENGKNGLEVFMDGESMYRFNSFNKFYSKLGKKLSIEYYGTIDFLHSYDSSINVVGNLEEGGVGIECDWNDHGVYFVANIDGTYYYTKSYDVEPDEFVHLVGTYDGTKMRLWVNGELYATKNIKGKIHFPDKAEAQYFSLGADPADIAQGSYPFVGTSVAVNVYNKALTGTELTYLYSQYK